MSNPFRSRNAKPINGPERIVEQSRQPERPEPLESQPLEPVDDLDLLAEVDRRPRRSTMLLVAGIVVALAFVGGVVVQKRFGGTTAAAGPVPGAGFS